jgi:hypothetical protein
MSREDVQKRQAWEVRLERRRASGLTVAQFCNGTQVEMDATDLALLLSGIELASVKRRPRYAQDAARGAPQEQGCSS